MLAISLITIHDKIKENTEYSKHVLKKLKKKPPSVTISPKDAAAIFLDRIDQRGYKALKSNIASQNVNLPSYEAVQDFLRNIDVGHLSYRFCNCSTACMSCVANTGDTLYKIISSDFWFSRMVFPSNEQQDVLATLLKKHNPEVFQSFDPKLRTVFIRMTGDNFRASTKSQTELISFSVLNVKELLHSPYGQFISCIFRGSESRGNLQTHTEKHYQDMKSLIRDGKYFKCPNGNMERMNVIGIMCADLGFFKEILGKCGTTGLYGCYYCKTEISKWDIDGKHSGKQQKIEEMCRLKKFLVPILIIILNNSQHFNNRILGNM